jgi:outer membrane protein assembly factor BamD (BamD/ComL family)
MAALLAGCSQAASDWKQADSQNTVAGYQQFLQQHPDSEHANAARERVAAMQDDEAWTAAKATNTVDSYQTYLTSQPKGLHSGEANTQITDLKRVAAWKVAEAANTESSVQDFLNQYATGPEADSARAQLQKLQTEKYRVRLGSFRDAAQAEKTRGDMQTRFASQLHQVVVVPPSGTDKLTHVSSAPMTEDDAKAACGSLKKLKQHCEVVKRANS